MSSSVVDTINSVSTKVYLYGCSCIIITGLFSNFINILLFSSKNYRTNPCSAYIITTEASNLCQILFFLLPTVIGLITGKNGTETSAWWCKLMNYFGDVCYALMIMCMCLASIDRFHSTSRSALRRQRSSIKVAKISIAIVIVVSLLLSIPDILYWIISDSFGTPMCIVVSQIYYSYFTYFLGSIIFTFLPIILLTVFGVLTYRNIKSVHHLNHITTIPRDNSIENAVVVPKVIETSNSDNINQRQKQKKILNNILPTDKQFSMMLILQIICFVIGSIPLTIKMIYSTVTTNYVKSDISQAMEGLLTAITWVICYIPTCSSYYIYYLSSSTYRQNVKKLLSTRKQVQIHPANNL